MNTKSDLPAIGNEFKTLHSNFFQAGFTSADDLCVLLSELDSACNALSRKKFTLHELRVACDQLKSEERLWSFVELKCYKA